MLIPKAGKDAGQMGIQTGTFYEVWYDKQIKTLRPGSKSLNSAVLLSRKRTTG